MKRLLIAALAVFALPAFAQRIAVNPTIPTYGETIAVEVRDTEYQMYLPATRYTRNGSAIQIEYEYGNVAGRADYGTPSVSLGELPPGNYTVEARIVHVGRPWEQPKRVTSNLPVMPPSQWGIYPVPREPNARSTTYATIRSAAYFDAASMRATVTGSVIRVDFVYDASAPAMGTTPPGLTTYASVELPPLLPGTYQLEGWGKASTGGDYERFFTRPIHVSSAVRVVEYYSAALQHYFMTAGVDEMEILDSGASGDWKRTGYSFEAWPTAADAPPGAVPVCRFYARGVNSHFYTGTPTECADLKALEQKDRADAAARGQPFLGWAYEGIAFYAVLPQGGGCMQGLSPVWRAYNNGAVRRDSNHRFTTDERQRAAMGATWVDEGAHLCAAG